MVDILKILPHYTNMFTLPTEPKYIIVIGDNQLLKVKRFTIRRSIENFLDTFDIEFGNIEGRTSPMMYLGDRVKLLRTNPAGNEQPGLGDTIFEGMIEKKETGSDGVDMQLKVSGRDTIVDLVESSAPFITFKKTTDNAIIQKIVEQANLGFELSLATAANISEYTVGPGDSIAAVIDGVAKLNNYFIWKRGNTIIKDRIKTDGQPVYHYHIADGGRINDFSVVPTFGSNVLKYSSEESIEDAKTSISGFSTSSGKSKANLKSTKNVDLFNTTAYQTMIRSEHDHNGSASRIHRPFTMSVAGKNLGECQREVEVAAKKAEPKIRISLTVKGFQDFELNDIISLTHDSEGINKNFVLTGVMYTLDEYNREISDLTLQPLGCYPR